MKTVLLAEMSLNLLIFNVTVSKRLSGLLNNFDINNESDTERKDILKIRLV